MDKEAARQLIDEAVRQGRRSLSEYEAKRVLAFYDIPVVSEILVEAPGDLASAVARIGYPVVMKGCAPDIGHKTGKNLIYMDIRNKAEAEEAFAEIRSALKGAGAAVLVQKMIAGRRELVLGMTRDPQFGPCVMFGLGGIFAEILEDIAFRKAPLDKPEALRMMQEIRGRGILGPVRGMEAADTNRLAEILLQLGQIGLDMAEVAEIDLNPVILAGSQPVAVDALMVLRKP